MKLNPNMTLKEVHDCCCNNERCTDCQFYCENVCKLLNYNPASWSFEEHSSVSTVHRFHRHAKAGEYITPNSLSCWCYGMVQGLAYLVSKRDDILKRVECMVGDTKICMNDFEYDVLENYVPDKKEAAPSAGDTENSGYKNTYGKSIGSEFENVNTLIGINADGSLIIKQLKPAGNGGENP
ncbi:hypothetical protein [Caproicibacterium amylolyticum]|uniref:Uncharacterized protein n=1 Tax=Caproicibacterium amylolyticum TaxID=2766537 RepID=A0A7G9WJV1_9FIRM|nr:hypothetical protein [Caproicibacterium amylolyticum]QNO18963.1 hypothetical protein H6X83_04880 [Caproicibacterium amylolyticum]